MFVWKEWHKQKYNKFGRLKSQTHNKGLFVLGLIPLFVIRVDSVVK